MQAERSQRHQAVRQPRRRDGRDRQLVRQSVRLRRPPVPRGRDRSQAEADRQARTPTGTGSPRSPRTRSSATSGGGPSPPALAARTSVKIWPRYPNAEAEDHDHREGEREEQRHLARRAARPGLGGTPQGYGRPTMKGRKPIHDSAAKSQIGYSKASRRPKRDLRGPADAAGGRPGARRRASRARRRGSSFRARSGRTDSSASLGAEAPHADRCGPTAASGFGRLGRGGGSLATSWTGSGLGLLGEPQRPAAGRALPPRGRAWPPARGAFCRSRTRGSSRRRRAWGMVVGFCRLPEQADHSRTDFVGAGLDNRPALRVESGTQTTDRLPSLALHVRPRDRRRPARCRLAEGAGSPRARSRRTGVRRQAWNVAIRASTSTSRSSSPRSSRGVPHLLGGHRSPPDRPVVPLPVISSSTARTSLAWPGSSGCDFRRWRTSRPGSPW